MISIEPKPGPSSQTRTCGGSTSRDIKITGPSTSNASPSCPSLTENTVPGCSSREESSNVSLLRGKHFIAHFFSNQCRVCLEKGTIPIYGSASGIGESISLIASVDIVNEKQFPRHLCLKCYSLLQGAMKFRKLAQQTDKILKQSNYASNKKHLQHDNGMNITHDPGTKLKQEASMDSYKAEQSESKLAYDFKQAYLMLISQSTPSGKHSGKYNNEARYKKAETNISSNSKPTFNKRGMTKNLYRCEICNKEFAKVHHKKHLAAHGMVQCKVCNSPYLKINYDKHMKEKHKKVRNYVCEICGCKKENTRQYNRHMAKHRIDSPFMCDVCGKAFKVQSYFANHRMIHDFSFPFQCDLCPYRARAKDLLKMHIRKHTGEKPFKCTECPFRSSNSSNLRKHMRRHTKQRNFRCDICGKGYFTKRDLERHIKAVHTGVKDHVCNICNQAFGYRHKLRLHERLVHKREKLLISGRMPSYLQIEREKQLEKIE